MAIYRGDGDPARNSDLVPLIEDLERTRGPLAAYCRRGPMVGRRVSNEEARVLNAEVTRTLRRMRAMLKRRSGSRRPAVVEPRRVAVDGACGRARQVIDRLRQDHEALRRVLASGSPRTMRSGAVVASTAELNDEAAKLLVDLRDTRWMVSRHLHAYRRGHLERMKHASNRYEVSEEEDLVEALVDAVRVEADQLRAEIVCSVKQREPERPQRPKEPYNFDDAAAAWFKFHDRHGRWPRKTDHHPVNGLPHYTQLHRVVGASPMAQMRARLVGASRSGTHPSESRGPGGASEGRTHRDAPCRDPA